MRPRKSIAKHAGPAGLGAVALCAPASLTVWPMGASTPGSNKPEFVPGMLANDTQNGSI